MAQHLSESLNPECRNNAKAATRNDIEMVCREEGIEPPTICTPEELLED